MVKIRKKSYYQAHKTAILEKAKEKYKTKKVAEENKENDPTLDALSNSNLN